MAALRDQVLSHGRPLAFYSDRHGIFRVSAKASMPFGLTRGTEFGRVVERLEIGLINGSHLWAKGHVGAGEPDLASAGAGSCRTACSKRCDYETST